MRILFLASSGETSGASVALLNLIKGLLAEQYEVHVVFPSRGPFYDQVEKLGIKCYYLGLYKLTIYPRVKTIRSRIKFPYELIRGLFLNYRIYKRLLKLCRNLTPDIIHTNVGPLDLGYKVAKKLNIKHVWHLREYQDLDFGMRYFPFKARFLKIVNDPLNHCIAITKGVYDYWCLKGENHIVIYDGVINDSFQKKPINNVRKKYFLFVGRIEEAKGIDFLLKVFAEFCQVNNDYNLLIAGKGQIQFFNECLEFVKAHNIENRVTFLGHRTDIYELMSQATALIVPSRFEGFGFITVEAMYNNCLVIGRNTAGTKEQFDLGLEQTNNEIALRFSSEEELLEKMRLAINLSSIEYNLITKRAFNVVCKNYSINNHNKKVTSFYKFILE